MDPSPVSLTFISISWVFKIRIGLASKLPLSGVVTECVLVQVFRRLKTVLLINHLSNQQLKYVPMQYDSKNIFYVPTESELEIKVNIYILIIRTIDPRYDLAKLLYNQ